MTLRRLPRIVLTTPVAVLLALSAAGCEGLVPATPSSPSAVGPSATEIATEQAACVDEVNRLRMAAGKTPLNWSQDIQAFSNEAARVDGEAHEAHKYFKATNGGNGAARAENLIPWWKLSQWGSVRKVIKEGLAMMNAEGSGGGHFDNMFNNYTEVACGIAVINGEVTVTQDFR
jgi:hypothetical protein